MKTTAYLLRVDDEPNGSRDELHRSVRVTIAFDGTVEQAVELQTRISLEPIVDVEIVSHAATKPNAINLDDLEEETKKLVELLEERKNNLGPMMHQMTKDRMAKIFALLKKAGVE